MFKYDLKKEFNISGDSSSISVSPHWVLAVIRFTQPLTFSRKRMFSGSKRVSFNDDNTIITKTRETLIIDDDCTSLQINQSKGSYVSSLVAVLLEGHNYLSEIMPSDWVMAWIVNSKQDAQNIKKKIKSLQSCNSFESGLKFVGRVQSIRKTINQDPSGVKNVRYQLQALGGQEFDSSIFYEPHLAQQEISIGQFLAKMNLGISDMFSASANQMREGKAGIDSNRAIPTLLKLMLGDGIPSKKANPSGKLQVADGLTNTPEAPYAYAVPSEIGIFLDRNTPSRPTNVLSFADTFELLIGLQKYSENSNSSLSGFIPDGVGVDDEPAQVPFKPKGYERLKNTSSRRITKYPLKGEFLPLPIPFANQSVWSVINQFLNPAVNEMYYTLRINSEQKIVPTLVVRQLPFSTEVAAEKLKEGVTSFLELPRWSIPTGIVKSLDIGRSDATHFNFIHVYGQSAATQGSHKLYQQVVRNPPIRDEQDIKRNGIKPYMQTVNCSIDDTYFGPKVWMEIISDFLVGQQFTLNGTLSIQGVQSPICPGDNLELDGVVYHIEAVTHSCVMAPNGTKSFNTTIALTHGIRSEDARGEVPQTKTVESQSTEELVDAIHFFDPLKYTKRTLGIKDSPMLYHVSDPYLKQIEVAGDRELNPDLFMYSGISPGDNMALGPGMTILTTKDDDSEDT